jgi:hypothetical protein
LPPIGKGDNANLEKFGLTRLDPEAFNGLLGQCSDNAINLATARPHRFDSHMGCVRQNTQRARRSPASISIVAITNACAIFEHMATLT